MYLITVYFDQKTNQILQRYINKIAEKTGNTYMTDNHVPPHMTVAAIEAKSVEVLQPAFNSLRGKIQQGTVSFVSIGQLLPYVMYVTPVLNRYLSDVSLQVYKAVKNIPETITH